MPLPPPSPLGRVLSAAVARVRELVGDPVAPVVVLTPSDTNGTLARQQLALAGDFVRVEMSTPEGLLDALGRRALAARGLRPQPGPWLGATVGQLIREMQGAGSLGRFERILGRPGWRGALAGAVEALEAAGVEPDALERLELPAHADRLRVLALLLRGVRRRRREDGLYALSDLCAEASRHLDAARYAGAVVLGDRLLAPRVHEVLAAWLEARPHVEVRPGPWHRLEPSPSGLRAASRGPVIDVPRDGDSWLDTLAGAAGGPSPDDGTVVLARTPDEVRGIGEAVRVVLAAVSRGVPLDRIAVVLPDAEQVDVLRGHLDRAGVPATWLVGPPVASTPAARFLVHALQVATGDDTVPAWYDLLRQPGLRLGVAVSAEVTRGRGRWRRILARCGAVRQTAAIVEAVEAWASALDDDPPESRTGDREAAAHLVEAIHALKAELDGLSEPAPLGGHARRWSRFLQTWWVPSPDREQVRSVLAGWGAPGAGAVVTLDTALAELIEALQQSPALQGTLSEPAVRVLTPMGLLGGAFEVVAVTGLTEGRLPRRPGEDPLLPDDLVASIAEATGIRMLDSRARARFEERRFAAIVSSCTGSLWLSAPASELLEERPLLPSTFLLDAATTRLGRRARYAELAALQRPTGSRARPWPASPDHAIDALEHRVSTTALAPEEGLRRLARHATARRLIGLHRALDADAPTPWTGLLPPGITPVPGLDGAPVSPWTLARLIRDPGAFLVEEVLRVGRLPELHASSDPMAPWLQDRRVLHALERALSEPEPLREAFAAAWDEDMARWRRHRVDVTDETVALMRTLAVRRVDRLLARGVLPRGSRRQVSGAPVPELPWVVEDEVGWFADDGLAVLRRSKPVRNELSRDETALVAVALAAAVDTITVTALDGQVERARAAEEASRLADKLVPATRCAQGGWWPWGRSHAVALAAEVPVDYAEHVDDVLGSAP